MSGALPQPRPADCRFELGMADLKQRLGPIQGDPLECEHPIDADGDTQQLTTTGLVSYSQRTETVTFTDGSHYWALTEGTLTSWTVVDDQ
jgi:hypothetical protein